MSIMGIAIILLLLIFFIVYMKYTINVNTWFIRIIGENAKLVKGE